MLHSTYTLANPVPEFGGHTVSAEFSVGSRDRAPGQGGKHPVAENLFQLSQPEESGNL